MKLLIQIIQIRNGYGLQIRNYVRGYKLAIT